jgi:hypothetical protein
MNNIIYQNRQWMKVLWITLPLITLIMLAIETSNQSAQQQVKSMTLLLLINAMVIAVIGSLKVSLSESQLIWQFGFLGKPKWTLDFDEIEKVELCKTSWVEGWGIRFTKEGMLYNAAGKTAIRIYKRDGKIIRLGSIEPDVLLSLIQQKIKPLNR